MFLTAHPKAIKYIRIQRTQVQLEIVRVSICDSVDPKVKLLHSERNNHFQNVFETNTCICLPTASLSAQRVEHQFHVSIWFTCIDLHDLSFTHFPISILFLVGDKNTENFNGC